MKTLFKENVSLWEKNTKIKLIKIKILNSNILYIKLLIQSHNKQKLH